MLRVSMGPPGVLGIWGEWSFISRDLGSTVYHFRGAGEQSHSLGDIRSPAKKQKIIKGKPPICLIFFLNSSASGGDTPLQNSECIFFIQTCTSSLIGEENMHSSFVVFDLLRLKL